MNNGKLRLDKYLWAIRVFKTRTQASGAIHAGRVRSNNSEVKPSKQVSIGDRYEIKAETRKWVIEVTGLPHHRVQFSEAVNYYTDLTPHQEIFTRQKSSFIEYTGKRQSRQGRPTKRNRRELGDFMNPSLP